MKHLLYISFLFLSLAAAAQPRYAILKVPQCWTTPTAVDSSVTRHVLIGTQYAAPITLFFTNANEDTVTVSGGSLAFGYCDCCGDGSPGGNNIIAINGLTQTGDTVTFGGVLIYDTQLDLGMYDLEVINGDTAVITGNWVGIVGGDGLKLNSVFFPRNDGFDGQSLVYDAAGDSLKWETITSDNIYNADGRQTDQLRTDTLGGKTLVFDGKTGLSDTSTMIILQADGSSDDAKTTFLRMDTEVLSFRDSLIFYDYDLSFIQRSSSNLEILSDGFTSVGGLNDSLRFQVGFLGPSHGAFFVDTRVTPRGIEYQSQAYRNTFSDSSLVDKGYVDAAIAASSYSGFTPAADSGTGSNVASGGTLQVNGSGSISTSVSDTTVTIDNNRFGNYIYTEDSITVDGTNFFGDGIAIYKDFLFSMSNGGDSLYVFDVYNNYNIVSRFPVPGTSSPFIHAWNNRLIVTRSDSIRVYDIKDLKNPILLHKQRSGVLNFPAQYNQFVFSSGGANDIYIFNTETFQTDTVIVPRSNVFQANSLAYDDGYLYAVGVDATPDSIFIINTKDKSFSSVYGQDGIGSTTYTYLFAQDKYLYALRSDTIDILNVSDPELPVLISKTKSFSGLGPFTRGLKVYGNYLIHCFSGGGFIVYDVSDKTNVIALDTVYTTIASSIRAFDIYDNKVYLLSRNEPTIVIYDLPSIKTGHLRSATIYSGKVRAENLITKEIETQGLVTTDLVVNSNVIFSDYGAGNKEAADLSKTDSGYRLGLATDGTVIEIPDSTPKAHIITRTIYDGDAALPDSTVAVNGTFNAGFWRVPESMDGYTLTKASFGIFDKGDMSTSGATYSFGVQKCNGSNMSCSNYSNVNFTPSSETELELTLSITLNANDILRVNYQPPQGCGGGCGTENVNGLVVTYTIQEN